MGSIIGTTPLCVPGLLSPISQKREQETNEYLSPQMMDQKVYGRMHTVEFLLVAEPEWWRVSMIFIVEGAWTQHCSLVVVVCFGIS